MESQHSVTIKLKREGQYLEIIQWCCDNLNRDEWQKTFAARHSVTFYFSREEDATMFILRWK